MRRLTQCSTFGEWFEPLHDIAQERQGLSDFGADKTYQVGLRKLLEQQDHCTDLEHPIGYAYKLAHMLEQRLITEQRFKDKPELAEVPIEKPLVITGMVRTGSTAMQHIAEGDSSRQHMHYWLSQYPQPRPPREAWSENPNFRATKAMLESMYERLPQTRAMHYHAADIPDECGHLLAQTFTDEYWQICSRVPLYNEWYEQCDMVPSYQQHRRLLQIIGSTEPEKPWTIKYPVHLKHLKSFLEVYPDARIIWTHRDPASVMASYANMNATNRTQSVPAETVDRDDLHLEQVTLWAAATERAYKVRERYPEAQFFDVHFDDFVSDQVTQMKKAYAHFGIDWADSTETAMRQWQKDNPRGVHGEHKHGAAQPLKMSRAEVHERFSSYIQSSNVSIKA